MIKKLLLSVLTFSTTLAFTFAEECQYGVCLKRVGGFINDTNQYVVAAFGTLLLAVSIVGFFFGVVRFIWAQQQGDEKGVKNGKETLKWGIIALFCAFSVYGIISFGQKILFSGSDATNIKIPKFIIDTTPTSSNTNTNNNSSNDNGSVCVTRNNSVAGACSINNTPGICVNYQCVLSSSAGGNRLTGPNYSQSPSNPNGSIYTGPGATTGGGRQSSTGRCTKNGLNGSYINGTCVIDQQELQNYGESVYDACIKGGGSPNDCQHSEGTAEAAAGGCGEGFHATDNGGCAVDGGSVAGSGASDPQPTPLPDPEPVPEQNPCDSAGC